MSSRSSNKAAVPEAKSALDRFKYEVAGELGVPLKDGYNGDLTSKQNGSVGGYMVKKIIETQERQMAGKYKLAKRRGNRVTKMVPCFFIYIHIKFRSPFSHQSAWKDVHSFRLPMPFVYPLQMHSQSLR